MMKWPGYSAIALLAALALPAMAQHWQVDPAHSTLTFTNSYQGIEYTGRFRRFDAMIEYDPNDLAHAKFDVTIDITSLDTQNSERDQAALGTAFFDTAKFPRAHFATSAFRKGADGRIVADGVLMLRGISKPVALTVSFKPHGDDAALDVVAQLKRLDFGIGAGQWADPSMIGDGVTVHGHLSLHAGRWNGRAQARSWKSRRDDAAAGVLAARAYVRPMNAPSAAASNGQPSSRPDASSRSTGTRSP
jgi:polyisoprenoid-binding protein YceI